MEIDPEYIPTTDQLLELWLDYNNSAYDARHGFNKWLHDHPKVEWRHEKVFGTLSRTGIWPHGLMQRDFPGMQFYSDSKLWEHDVAHVSTPWMEVKDD